MRVGYHWGLKDRTIALCVLLLLGTVVTLSTVLLCEMRWNGISDLTEQAVVYAQTLGHIAEPAVLQRDRVALERVAQAATQPAAVRWAMITDARGQPLAQTRPVADFVPEARVDLSDPAQRPPTCQSQVIERTVNQLTILVPICRAATAPDPEPCAPADLGSANWEEPLGFVCLAYTLADMNRGLGGRILNLILLSGLVLGLAVVVTWLAMRSALRSLWDTARKRAAEALHQRDAILEAISFAAARFLNVGSWSEDVQQVLARLGSATRVSRVYIFENSPGASGELLTSQTYEWVAEGIRPEIDNPQVQHLSYRTSGLRRWETALRSGEAIHGHIRDFPPAERDILLSQGIVSIVVVPIMVGTEWWGFVGFDECTREREWSRSEIDALRTAADTLGTAVQRQRAQEILRDQTAQISAALERERQTSLRLEAARQQLEIAVRAADAANHAKSAFLANMSHEIRTPLTAILGFTDLLRRGADEGMETERQSWLETIFTSSQHLFNLLNDILDLSKIEAGRLEVERVPVHLPELIREIVSVMRIPAAQKGLSIDVRYATDIPATILSDPTRLRQILVNLVSNGIKFTHKGGVTIVVRWLEGPPEARLSLQVIDTGIGIPKDKLLTLFRPFAQADASITRRYGGTGLGLAISRRLAEALGGQITVESEEGRGSVFTVEIDPGRLDGVGRLPGHTGEMHIRPQAQRPQRLATTLRGRILLVEDGVANRKLIGLALRRAGATVTLAENGQAGVELALREPFDLILMDIQMPVMDGYTATRLLREHGLKLPVIALTAHAMANDAAKCLEAGCSGYLSKPVNIDLLIDTVAEALAQALPRTIPPLTSTLPTDDPEFREAVMEFITRLNTQMQAMRTTFEAHDWAGLRRLAHWLKGSGGTAGFVALTDAARELEQLIQDGAVEEVARALAELTELAARVSVGRA